MVETDRKRPWLAAALTMLTPGLGHLYLREWFRAILWFGLIMSAASFLVPTGSTPAELTVDAFVQASVVAAEKTPIRNQIALFAITAISMGDAYWTATRGNLRAAADEGTCCPNCGKEIDESLDFCHWCTTRIEAQD